MHLPMSKTSHPSLGRELRQQLLSSQLLSPGIPPFLAQSIFLQYPCPWFAVFSNVKSSSTSIALSLSFFLALDTLEAAPWFDFAATLSALDFLDFLASEGMEGCMRIADALPGPPGLNFWRLALCLSRRL